MKRSSKHYRAPTRVRRPNRLPVIFNTARLRSASSRVRRLARTVLRVYVYSLLLLLTVRSCVQVIGYTAEAVKTLATDPNKSNLSLASDQSPDECPLTEVIDDCLSSLFGKWAWHSPGDCDVDCPQVAVNESDGHLNTCLIEVPRQETMQNQSGPVGPEGTSGQCQLPLPVASYSTAFKTMFNGITFPIDFILWHTTLVTCNLFIHISLILYEFGPPLWTMNRETWRKLRKASSLSGKRGISRCQKTRVLLCVYLCSLSTHCLCMAVLKRFKHQALFNQICRQLLRIPSLGLGREVRCGQKIHGRLVTSFTVQKSFVKHIWGRPSTFCHALLRRAACIGMWLSEAVVKPYVFLRGLLLLAGDVERNPGPLQDGSPGPMSPWNNDALVSLKERLKLNVSMNTGLCDRLEKAAGGFMSRPEAQMVTGLSSKNEQIDKIIETLRGKTNEDFATFCTMLRETNHVVWVDELEKEAERFKRERKDDSCPQHAQRDSNEEEYASDSAQGVFGDGGGQENMSPPTPGAPHVRGRPPGDTGYGLPPPTWAPPQTFYPRQEVPYPHDVRQHVGQHQVPYTVGPVCPPLGYPYPPPPQGWFPPHQGTHIHPYWGAPGPSGVTAPPPPPAPLTLSMVAPTPPTQPFTAASDSPGPSQRAQEVLDHFREQFISDMDADAVVYNFQAKCIIDSGDLNRITQNANPQQKNQILHLALKQKCTDKALMDACDIIIPVKNRKMTALAEDMRRALNAIKGGGGGGGGGGPSGGSGSEGEEEFQHFSDALRDEYQKITVVFAPHKLEQEMEFINLALSRFIPKSEDDQLKFVRSMTEGIDRTFTELQGKVEYGSIMSLVKKHRLVVISGAPGTGKTTLTKKLCKDVSMDMASHGYKLVVKVELRDIVPLVQDPSSFELKHLMDLFESVGEMERVVGRMKATCGADTLLILDGYDELPHDLRQSPFFVNLLSPNPLRSPLRKSHIILSSRSIVMSEIHDRFKSAQVPLLNIEVLGFTSEQIQHFIDQYFEGEGKSELSAKLSAKLDALPHIKGLCSIPVMLSIISRVFLSRKDLPPTLTQLYDEFVCETVSSMFPGLQSTLKIPVKDHDFLKLCKIANECTMQQKLIFTSSDLMGLQDKYSNRETGCGLLTARPVDKLRCIIAESFFFIHFTVQEFLTAAHIARLEVAAQCAFWDEHLGQPHLAQTWRFYCGITKMAHYDLLQNSKVRGIKGFKELLMQSFFETQDRDLVGRLMPSVMREVVLVEPKTAYDSIAFGFCLEQHSSLQQCLEVQLPGGGVVVEVQRVLEPCLRHRQLQTLEITGRGSPEDWRQVEDLFDRISNCDGALKGHFGKVYLEQPPLSVAVKLLCLQHVREVDCRGIQGCEAMDHEFLKEMEKALGENKTLQTLTLSDDDDVTLPKEFCRHLMIGIGLNTSLSKVNLNFAPINWDCPIGVPADIHSSVQHVTLWFVPVDVLPRLFLLFSQAKHFECRGIRPPQERARERDVKFTEVEQTLSGMGRLEKLVLGNDNRGCWSDALMVEFGVSVLKGISGNDSLTRIVLYDKDKRVHLLHSIIDRLPTDVQRQFIIDKCTDECGDTFPCISLSASGTHLPTSWGAPSPSGITASPSPMAYYLHMVQTSLKAMQWPSPLAPPETHLPIIWGAPGPSGITAPPPPTAPPTSAMVAPTPPTQPFTAASDSPGPSQRGPTHHPLAVGAGVSPALHGHECAPPPPPRPPSLGEHAGDCCCCSRCTVL